MQQIEKMLKIFVVLSFGSILLFFSCLESKRQNISFSENGIDHSDEKMTVIYDTICKIWFANNNYTHFEPTKNDINETDFILEIAIKKGEFNFLKNPDLGKVKDYYRQYVCYFDENKHKIIRINAFCRNLQTPTEINGEIVWKPYDWKNNLVIVNDGGSCYWTIYLDLNKKKYFDFTVNGVA